MTPEDNVMKADGYDNPDGGDDDEAAEPEVENDEGEDKEEDEAEKSDISASDLMKSIEAYSAVEDALDRSGMSRESYLAARLDSGTITKSERSELGKIWAGLEDDEGEYNPDIQKSVLDVVENDDDAHLVDASGFLKSLVDGVDTRMEQVLGEVSRDGRATRELLKAQGSLVKSLAYVISSQEEMIKGLGDRLNTVESSPAPRRAVRATPKQVRGRGLMKGAVAEYEDEQMSKGEITQGLRTLMIHASEKGDETAMDKIVHATALFEQTGQIKPHIMEAVTQVTSH